MFKNFESEAYPDLTLAGAIEKSCDTVFYKLGYDQWLRDGGTNPVAHPADIFLKVAKQFGFGRKTGIDLPDESSGLIADRQYLLQQWQQNKSELCAIGAGKVKGQTAYQRAIAAEDCVDGYQLRAGDAVNFAIGQGDTLTTPLQLATTYAAIANGGSLLQPQVARAIVSPSGKVVKVMKPKVTGNLGISAQLNADLTGALVGVTTQGTAQGTFAGFPLSSIPVAGKTGTAEGINAQPTAWFASFAPANNPRYAVVVMISQGGTGASAAAPAVRKIYEALFGIKGSTIDPKNSVLPDGDVPTRLRRSAPTERSSRSPPTTSPAGRGCRPRCRDRRRRPAPDGVEKPRDPTARRSR